MLGSRMLRGMLPEMYRTITTIVVTKFHPATLVRELHDLGVRDFGESRHQEAQPKIAGLADLDATWHFVGQLQSKKARQVAAYVDVVHSVDRDSLVDAIAGLSARRVHPGQPHRMMPVGVASSQTPSRGLPKRWMGPKVCV